jgi:hypothetical protein
MARYFRSNYYDALTEPGTGSQYTVMHDKYQDNGDKWESGFPVGTVRLDYEEGKGTTPNFSNLTNNGYSREYYNRNGGNRGRTVEPPTELFHTDPDRLVVTSAYAHPNVRNHVPKLLAIAQTDNPHLKLTASDDMTEYSSRLAKNAVAKGLALPHPDNKQMKHNGITMSAHDDEYSALTLVTPNEPVGMHRIPQSDVLKGAQFMRVALGRGRMSENTTPAPKFDQPQLPGMEDK